MQTVLHKRGDTFIPRCTYLNSSGVAADYSALGITIKSQVRTQSQDLLSTLTVTAGPGTGEFVLESGSTQNWPLGTLLWDIQFLQGSHVFSTKTAAILLEADVTV
jgi:hypothetical protein